MVDTLVVAEKNATKKEKYEVLLPQLKALVEGEQDLIANVANLMAALKDALDFFWVGVYFVKEQDLVLGPFQGPLACTRIGFGKGVCGAAWKEKKAIIVPDVDLFPGHIACNSLSRSEIVLPIFRHGEVFMILDVDSKDAACFDEIDQHYLQQVIDLIEAIF